VTTSADEGLELDLSYHFLAHTNCPRNTSKLSLYCYMVFFHVRR